MTAAGIPALLEPIQERLRRDTGTVAAPTDTARLLAAVKAVDEMHRPVKIYDECECLEGTRPEDYDYFDCEDYSGCHNSISGIGCEECCVDGDYLSQACGESHAHTMNESERCPTVSAVEAALGEL